jgi:lauroyl/myristoyl acyltransferase
MSRDILDQLPWLKRWAFRVMDGIANRLPMVATALLAHGVGTLFWLFDPRGRRVVGGNLAHFIPGPCAEARRRAVLASYRLFALSLSEGLRLGRLPEDYLAGERLRLVDPWKVFASRPLVGPAILVTVHANWELMLAAVQRLGLIAQVEAVTLRQGDPAIDHLLDRKRSLVGCRSLLLDRAPLAALRALKAGRILGLLADRNYTGTGLVVPFAGAPVSLPAGPAALAMQTGAPVVPMFLARQGHRRFLLLVGRPLRPSQSLPKAAQMRDLTERLAAAMGRFIAAAPAQWVAFHDAWPRPSPP